MSDPRGIPLPQTPRLLLHPQSQPQGVLLILRHFREGGATPAQPGGHRGLSGEGAPQGHQLGLPVPRRQQVSSLEVGVQSEEVKTV